MQKSVRQKKTGLKNASQRSLEQRSAKQRLDLELDRQLEDTFPASDALKITLRHPDRPVKSTRRARSAR